MMPFRLQLVAVVVALVYLGYIAHLIRSRSLSLRDSLSWLMSTVALLVVAVFPRVLNALSSAVGVAVPANALFAIAFVYVLWNLLSSTLAVSASSVRVRRLSQECALLRAELDALKRQISPPTS